MEDCDKIFEMLDDGRAGTPTEAYWKLVDAGEYADDGSFDDEDLRARGRPQVLSDADDGTALYVVLLVDHGAWRDPTVHGPFTSREQARERVASEWPHMATYLGDPDDFIADDESAEALILPLAAL